LNPRCRILDGLHARLRAGDDQRAAHLTDRQRRPCIMADERLLDRDCVWSVVGEELAERVEEVAQNGARSAGRRACASNRSRVPQAGSRSPPLHQIRRQQAPGRCRQHAGHEDRRRGRLPLRWQHPLPVGCKTQAERQKSCICRDDRVFAPHGSRRCRPRFFRRGSLPATSAVRPPPPPGRCTKS
jgi:hypothetical protein